MNWKSNRIQSYMFIRSIVPFFSYLFFGSFLFLACRPENPPTQQIPLSTTSDSARYYYRLGWQQIMDRGQYSASEASFRRAMDFDPAFTLCKSVLARVTTDLEERLGMYEELEEEKAGVEGPERAILDVYLGLVAFTNLREQDRLDEAAALLNEVLILAEKNFGMVARSYPEEVYIQCEYIEILHAVQGPREALDSILALTTKYSADNPFLLAYQAALHSELEDFDRALDLAEQLETSLDDPSFPKPYTVYANIYFDMDSLELAKEYADMAYFLDPHNLDASRLQAQINAALADRTGL